MTHWVEKHTNPARQFGTQEWLDALRDVSVGTLRSAVADCRRVAPKLQHLKEYCESHGIEWSQFCCDLLDADPRVVEAVQGIARLCEDAA